MSDVICGTNFRNFAGDITLLAADGDTGMHCLFCKQPIQRDRAWRVASDRFYCSEFCAEAETENRVPGERPGAHPRPRPAFQKAQMDRRYVERLQRLLPLRRTTVLPAA
jgi:hypothetical protein